MKIVEIIDIEPSLLIPYPQNKIIYGDEPVDPSFVETIRQQGQLDLIVITQENVIISGHRRWLALLQLGMIAKCLVVIFGDKNEERLAHIEYNNFREKTTSQIYSEVTELRDILQSEAKVRQLIGLGHSDSVDELNSSQLEPGRTNEKLSEITGTKIDRLKKIVEMGDAAKTDEFVKKLKDIMNSGAKTVNAVYCNYRVYKISQSDDPKAKYASKLLNKIEKDEMSENQAFKKLKEYEKKPIAEADTSEEAEVKEGAEEVDPKKEKKYDSQIRGKYDVLLIDPLSTEENPEYILPSAANSIVFMMADSQNLFNELDQMSKWGYEYRSMCVLTPRKKPGRDPWFSINHTLILIGTRGHIVDPIKKDYSSVIEIKTSDNVIAKIYDMIEDFYPNAKWGHIREKKKNAYNREGWNVDDEDTSDGTGVALESDTQVADGSKNTTESINVPEKHKTESNSEDIEEIKDIKDSINPEEWCEIKVSKRVYDAYHKNTNFLDKLLFEGTYNKNAQITTKNSTLVNSTIKIIGSQLSLLNAKMMEYGAADLNEVIVRLMIASNNSHPMTRTRKKITGKS
jgi:hypothetical protein